ncbi:MAG: LysR family transcriptional regulator [Bacteroidota bacterium]
MSTHKCKPDISVHFKIWLESGKGEGIMGDGKWTLLKTIQETGSLRAAALQQNISYRKAWGDLKKMEDLLGVALIEKHRGGSERGSTVLTDKGRHWLTAYLRFKSTLEKTVHSHFSSFLKELYK